MKGIFLGIAATILLSVVAGVWLSASIQQNAEQRYAAPSSVRL